MRSGFQSKRESKTGPDGLFLVGHSAPIRYLSSKELNQSLGYQASQIERHQPAACAHQRVDLHSTLSRVCPLQRPRFLHQSSVVSSATPTRICEMYRNSYALGSRPLPATTKIDVAFSACLNLYFGWESFSDERNGFIHSFSAGTNPWRNSARGFCEQIRDMNQGRMTIRNNFYECR
jgi:hypothetical protein